MHSLAMACVGLVLRPIPEPGLENAGVVGRAGVRISGTMPRRRARTGNSYSPLCAALSCYRLRLGVELERRARDYLFLSLTSMLGCRTYYADGRKQTLRSLDR